jgi:uncharacterized membrane protein
MLANRHWNRQISASDGARVLRTYLAPGEILKGGWIMTKSGNLWAVGYDDMKRANQVREEIISLGWDKHYLMLDDVAVIARHPDGSFTLNREKFPAASNIVGASVVGFLAGLVVGTPITGATIGAMVGSAGSVAVSASVGIGDDFVEEVKELMKPGTSAIFVLDDEGDMDVILRKIRGLGGTVLKTNVDLERAQLIQSTLAAPSTQPGKSDAK